MRIICTSQIDAIQATYSPGTKIMLISRHDGPKLQQPEIGLVTSVDACGTVHATLSSGAKKALNCTEDKFVMLSHFTAEEYLAKVMYLPEDDGILYAEECGGSVVSIGSGQLVELAQRYADRNIEITHELAIQLQKPYDMSVTYDCFLSSHIVNYHELRLDNPYIKIINLAHFKQFVRGGGKLRIIRNTMRPELEDTIIVAKSVFTNHIYYVAFNNPDHPLAKVNDGLGMRMNFTRASDYIFGKEFIVFYIHNKNEDQIEWTALPKWYPVKDIRAGAPGTEKQALTEEDI